MAIYLPTTPALLVLYTSTVSEEFINPETVGEQNKSQKSTRAALQDTLETFRHLSCLQDAVCFCLVAELLSRSV